jgi:hypothetical protein
MNAVGRRVLLWEANEPKGGVVEFRLTYEGPLLSASPSRDTERARVGDKHAIRRHFHRQMKKLWYTNPNLLSRATTPNPDFMFDPSGIYQKGEAELERLANNWVENGFRFVPLVHKGSGLNCRIEILMLRESNPGSILQNRDIDNRIKTLFDSLQKPASKQELGDAVPEEGEDPFFVLLEDDRLITHLSVETDVLLSPVNNRLDDVRLVLSCKVWPYRIGVGNMDLI